MRDRQGQPRAGAFRVPAVLSEKSPSRRSAKLLPHLRRRPSSFFYIPGYIAVSWLMALIKIHALATIRQQRWLTRQVAVENGTVVRTNNTADTATAEATTAGTTTPDKAQPEDVPA